MAIPMQARAIYGDNELSPDKGEVTARDELPHTRIMIMSLLAIAAKHAGYWLAPEVSCTCAAGTPFWKLVLKQFDDLLVKVGPSMRRIASLSNV